MVVFRGRFKPPNEHFTVTKALNCRKIQPNFIQTPKILEPHRFSG